ncbi:MAG: winged helix-turn-helix domain-containing protein [Caldilineaceae bacterium]|nr:winged helix-turn-helix domain-containing protein [Caldilineaceae bacterium]
MKYLTFRASAHAVMLAFAVASLDNVHKFFAHAGHDGLAAWALAGALGAALVTLSIMLTHIDRDADRRAWATMAAAALAVGVLSGSLQTSTYRETLQPLTAALLGFGVPLVGEVLLALAVSAYEKSQARAAYRNVGQLVEGAVAGQLAAAVDTFDGAAIQRHVETTINRLAKQAVNHVAGQAMAFYVDSVQPVEEPEAVQGEPRAVVDVNAKTGRSAEIEPKLNAETDWVDQGNTARSNAKSERMEQLVQFYGENPNASQADAADHIGRSKATVNSYLKELEEAGRVHVNGSVQVLG